MENREIAAQRLSAWITDMETFSLPSWNNLPDLGLYMDQVLLLMGQYLEPLVKNQDEKAITASIINNYVRMKIMPAPVKKKYDRKHLACLVMILVLKQSLSISCIQRFLPQEQDEETIRHTYEAFVSQFTQVSGDILPQIRRTESLLSNAEGSIPCSYAIVANLTKSLTEYLLQTNNQKV